MSFSRLCEVYDLSRSANTTMQVGMYQRSEREETRRGGKKMKTSQGKFHKGYDLTHVDFRQMQGISERRKAFIQSVIQ